MAEAMRLAPSVCSHCSEASGCQSSHPLRMHLWSPGGYPKRSERRVYWQASEASSGKRQTRRHQDVGIRAGVGDKAVGAQLARHGANLSGCSIRKARMAPASNGGDATMRLSLANSDELDLGRNAAATAAPSTGKLQFSIIQSTSRHTCNAFEPSPWNPQAIVEHNPSMRGPCHNCHQEVQSGLPLGVPPRFCLS